MDVLNFYLQVVQLIGILFNWCCLNCGCCIARLDVNMVFSSQ